MAARLVGIEEELLLLDPATRRVVPRARDVLAQARCLLGEPASGRVGTELFLHQVELRTTPVVRLGDAGDELRSTRAVLSRAARACGAAAAAVATAPLGGELRLTPDVRYEDMRRGFGELVEQSGTCGMHVHVAVSSPEEGVGVLDRIGPWLPVLRALGANSPYALGRDTGYASWRSQLWAHWPTAGPTEVFGSPAAYQRLCRQLLEHGAARDRGMLYFDARLSAHVPTVEVRVLDVCTDPDDVLVVAALVRALCERAAADWAAGGEPPRWRTEALRAAHWRASRQGTAGTLVDPVRGELAPAGRVVCALGLHVAEELDAAGDLGLVEDGLARLVEADGAARQRAAFRQGGLPEVVDDVVRRTEGVWRTTTGAGVGPTP